MIERCLQARIERGTDLSVRQTVLAAGGRTLGGIGKTVHHLLDQMRHPSEYQHGTD